MKDDRFASVEIGGSDSQRNQQLFESFHFQRAGEECNHSVVRGKAVARNGPAGEGGEANGARQGFKFLDGKAAAIRGSDERADTGACDEPDGDAFFFENFQDSDVSHATGETTAEGESDNRSSRAGSETFG